MKKEQVSVYKNKSLESLPGEQWREIPYTEGYYQISNLGRVKALARKIYTNAAPAGRWLKERILSQSVHRQANQYTGDETLSTVVAYRFEGTKMRAMVRRLVYQAFVLPRTKEKMDDKCVYTIDGNGLNNRWDNLGLASKSSLRLRGLQNERYVPPFHLLPLEFYQRLAAKNSRNKRVAVNKYKPDGSFVASYPSLTKAAVKNKVSIGNLGQCLTGKVKLLKGHVYRYAAEGYNGELKNWKAATGKKKIIQYHINGVKLAEFKSILDATRQLQIEASTIIRAAKKRSKHAGGFVWRYEGEEYKGEYHKALAKKKFAQYDAEGKQIAVFESISEAAKKTSGTYEGIRLTLQKKANSSGGFFWKWLQ